MPRRKVDVKKQISHAFIESKRRKNTTALTWAELLRETGVSKGALSKYLNKMVEIGLVETEVLHSQRPPRTVYRLSTEKAGRALDYFLVPMQSRLQDYKQRLENVKRANDRQKQKCFDEIFVVIVFNLLADQLASLEAALTTLSRLKSKKHALELYSFLWEASFNNTGKAIFELLASNPEYVKLFGRRVNDVIWIAEETRPDGEKPSEIDKALKELVAKLGIKES